MRARRWLPIPFAMSNPRPETLHKRGGSVGGSVGGLVSRGGLTRFPPGTVAISLCLPPHKVSVSDVGLRGIEVEMGRVAAAPVGNIARGVPHVAGMADKLPSLYWSMGKEPGNTVNTLFPAIETEFTVPIRGYTSLPEPAVVRPSPVDGGPEPRCKEGSLGGVIYGRLRMQGEPPVRCATPGDVSSIARAFARVDYSMGVQYGQGKAPDAGAQRPSGCTDCR